MPKNICSHSKYIACNFTITVHACALIETKNVYTKSGAARLNVKLSSYQYMNWHYRVNTVSWLPHHYNRNHYDRKEVPLHCTGTPNCLWAGHTVKHFTPIALASGCGYCRVVFLWNHLQFMKQYVCIDATCHCGSLGFSHATICRLEQTCVVFSIFYRNTPLDTSAWKTWPFSMQRVIPSGPFY